MATVIDREKLARAVSGSRLTLYDEQTELLYVWNGAHTVNIYDLDGNPLDVFTFGDFGRNEMSAFEAEVAIYDRQAIDRGEVEDE